MNDRYPEKIEFEFDRDALCQYLRRLHLIVAVAIPAFLSILWGLADFGDTLASTGFQGYKSLGLLFVWSLGKAMLLTGLVGGALYCLFGHRQARKTADACNLSVEGNFLRIISSGVSRIDRKLHFRSIIDYTLVESKAMKRFGVKGLKMNTIGGQNCVVSIAGLKECEKVRDMLAEIDSLRER